MVVLKNVGDSSWWEGKYVYIFRSIGNGKGAIKYNIISRKDRAVLGHVRWNGVWHKYTFYPADGTFYDERSLEDISSFIKDRTKYYKDRYMPVNEKLEREKRMEMYKRNRLTKEARSGRVDSVDKDSENLKNSVVEGLTPLEVELGTIDF